MHELASAVLERRTVAGSGSGRVVGDPSVYLVRACIRLVLSAEQIHYEGAIDCAIYLWVSYLEKSML